jgi:NCAIR mutase (PurE)-related protein
VRPADLKRLLGRVRRGTLSPAAAAKAIAAAPVEHLEFATLDHQRSLRVGFPEVIFGLGKTPRQVVAIATRLAARHPVILATRLAPEAQEALRAAFPKAEIHERARVAIIRRASPRVERGARKQKAGVGRVLVICAGTADLPVAEEALLTARVLGSRAELIADVGVAGLHRLLAHRLRLRGARVL